MSYFNEIALFSDTATKIGKFWCSGIYKVLYIIFCYCFYIRFCAQLLRLILRLTPGPMAQSTYYKFDIFIPVTLINCITN